jgi:hypothetical protein
MDYIAAAFSAKAIAAVGTKIIIATRHQHSTAAALQLVCFEHIHFTFLSRHRKAA